MMMCLKDICLLRVYPSRDPLWDNGRLGIHPPAY